MTFELYGIVPARGFSNIRILARSVAFSTIKDFLQHYLEFRNGIYEFDLEIIMFNFDR